MGYSIQYTCDIPDCPHKADVPTESRAERPYPSLWSFLDIQACDGFEEGLGLSSFQVQPSDLA